MYFSFDRETPKLILATILNIFRVE